MSTVAAIVLAAGASRRLGTPKQLVQIGAETLLERTVCVAIEAGLSPVLGVVSADLTVEYSPVGMIRVVNPNSADGMASSITAGLRALESWEPSASGAIILACDQPAVTGEHLRQLAKGAAEVVASSYGGRKGVPAYFPRTAFADLLELQGDFGARSLLRDARAIALPGGELDIDTVEDLDLARKLYAS